MVDPTLDGLSKEALINVLMQYLAAGREHHAALQRIGTALGLPAGADLHRDCVPAIEELRKNAAGGVPEGYRLVPVELTQEMVKAGANSGGLGMDFHEWMGRLAIAWRNILAAAPTSPDGDAGRRGQDDVISAAVNLVKVKGRYHTEQAYERLVEAVGAMATGGGGKP